MKAKNRHQVAEYNMVVARCRSAKQMLSFNQEENIRLFPNIMWLPSRSTNPRDSHREFYYKIFPKNDPFWNLNQPGNEWGCKCDWQETAEEATGVAPKINTTIPGLNEDLLQQKTKGIFSHEASYLNYFDKKEGYVRKKIRDEAILKLGEAGFYNKKAFNGAKIRIHGLHNMTEIAGNLEVAYATCLSLKDIESISFLPDTNQVPIELKKLFYPDGLLPRGTNSSADAILKFKDGQIWVVDFKNLKGNGSENIFKKRLKEAYNQGDYAIIKYSEIDIIPQEVFHIADTYLGRHKDFKGILIFNKKETLLYERYN